jgi:site-specific DNA recombinase
MVTVVAYERVSTDRQAEKQTIVQQIERLQTYAQQHQLPLTGEQIYRDDGYSGARLDGQRWIGCAMPQPMVPSMCC